MAGYRSQLLANNIEPVQVFSFGNSAKNAADIELVVDALAVATDMPWIELFVIVSGDGDFVPLIRRLHALGKRSLVATTSQPKAGVVNAKCSRRPAHPTGTFQSQRPRLPQRRSHTLGERLGERSSSGPEAEGPLAQRYLQDLRLQDPEGVCRTRLRAEGNQHSAREPVSRRQGLEKPPKREADGGM
jgi:hypothetical protein